MRGTSGTDGPYPSPNDYFQGQAELIPGVLFIDEVHMLDLECFTFLHRVLESEVSPIIVFATNRGRVKAQEGDEEHLHGIPADLLDRLMIVVTTPHTSEDIMEVGGKSRSTVPVGARYLVLCRSLSDTEDPLASRGGAVGRRGA